MYLTRLKDYEEDFEWWVKKINSSTMPERVCIPNEPYHISHQAEPWNNLHNTRTLQSSRRLVFHHDPLAPNDSLDFILKSVYEHDKGLFKTKADTLVQKETLTDDHSRQLVNREKIPEKKPLVMDHPLRIIPSEKMEDFNSVKLAIESYHTQITNRGYCRKPDGGYYST
ncbi:protein CFAP276 isoform X2 [Octopus bimaculoides]|uniref:protein CFAP276 isoform X2 n=1 Tax=Octopus bimaculoides TaxID=37653 RepID=UPI0022E2374A|nr:protein CFAP276 isoform X2 [Octopus bimaculoides]